MIKIILGLLGAIILFGSSSPLLATFLILSILNIATFIGLVIYIFNHADEVELSDETREIGVYLFLSFLAVAAIPETLGFSLIFFFIFSMFFLGDAIGTRKIYKIIKKVVIILLAVDVFGGYAIYSSFTSPNENRIEMTDKRTEKNIEFIEKKEESTNGESNKIDEKKDEEKNEEKSSSDIKNDSVDNVKNIIKNAEWIRNVNGVDDTFANSYIAEKILVEHESILKSDNMPRQDVSANTMAYKSKPENIVGNFVRVNGTVEEILDASEVFKRGVDPSLEDVRIAPGYFENNFKNIKYIYVRTSDGSIVRGEVTLNLLDFSNIKNGDSIMMDGFILAFWQYRYRGKPTKQEFWLIGYGKRNEEGGKYRAD